MNTKELQEWMHQAVIAPLAPKDCADHIRSTPTLPAQRRIEIYQGMIQARMEDSLREDYPLLEHVVGARRFDKWVTKYLRAYPSTSYTLNDLGNHFPKFLGQATVPPYAEEIARFELANIRSFHAEEKPSITTEEIQKTSMESLVEKTIRPVPSFLGEGFRYNIPKLAIAFDREALQPKTPPEKQNTHALFVRQDFSVSHLTVDEATWRLFKGLTKYPLFGQALDPALALATTPETQQNLIQSFHAWVASGLLCWGE